MAQTRTLYRYPMPRLKSALHRSHEPVNVLGLSGTFSRYAFTQTVTNLNQSTLVIVPDEAEADAWASDLEFFLGGTFVVRRLPEFDTSRVHHLGSERRTVMDLHGVLASCIWDERPTLLIATARSMQRKVISRTDFDERTTIINTSEAMDRDEFAKALTDAGYLSVPSVEDRGTFALRGSVCDVFPIGQSVPFRIELWGDEIETIRPFDVRTQRCTGAAVESLVMPPAREEVFSVSAKQRAKRGILTAAGRAGIPTRQLQPLLDDLANGVPFVGMEAVRAFFYKALDSVLSYLPNELLCCWVDPLGCQDAWQALSHRADAQYTASLDAGELVAPPELSLQTVETLHDLLRSRRLLKLHVLDLEAGTETGEPIRFQTPEVSELKSALQEARNQREPLRPLLDHLRACRDAQQAVMIVCSQRLQRERLERLCKNFGLSCETRPSYEETGSSQPWSVQLVEGVLSGSTILLDSDTLLLSEVDVFGAKVRRRKRKNTSDDSPFVQDFRELKMGDYVVHADHGIGLYEGLKKLVVGALESDFLVVAFAGQDKLYLPIYKLGRLQKYSGGGQNPRVTKLGGTSWEKVKSKAREAAEEDALALLELYARREMASGYAFAPPGEYFRAFENTFPFEETDDQARSIDEVLADMGRTRPMDRLLCGDVGFGKTEVALRAAMRAVLDGKQVCLLVPTTVLSLQHFKTFRDRFSDYPIEIALFSRLVSNADLKSQLLGLKQGQIDIAVGTHRLLGRDVHFKDLGLLILDEEHRFGVKHKDRIKEIRANVDVLAMTATPIPRTLQMSLSGIRDLSVIQTPPADRLSVRTFVCRTTDDVVRDAIRRELSRGGQVFFVHNRVQSIESRAAWLQSLVPEARIVIGHGQMSPESLEKVMLEFTNGLYNVLLSTTIIESGIDIPTANTMLIDKADQFGLAQLYQLRGRVGRGKDRGYCYCLVPTELALKKDAKARLAVIQQFTELGSGFHVASYDLEQRGAGELLGTRQKGQAQSVGIDLYAELLEDAIRTLRGETQKVVFDPELQFSVNARIPETYIEVDTLRLRSYKRLSNADDEQTILELLEEFTERFGAPPPPVLNLIELMRVRCLAKRLGLGSVESTSSGLTLTFDPQTPVSATMIFALIQQSGSRFSVPANYKLKYQFAAEERANTLVASRMCLQTILDLATEHGLEAKE